MADQVVAQAFDSPAANGHGLGHGHGHGHGHGWCAECAAACAPGPTPCLSSELAAMAALFGPLATSRGGAMA